MNDDEPATPIERPAEGQPLPAPSTALWIGDSGTLREPSRRALAALVKGPYVSADRNPELWRSLLADTSEIRSRLADLFLELAIDQELGIAFVHGAKLSVGTAPQLVRTIPLTFVATVLLLHLRSALVRGAGSGRVIVSKSEVIEELQVYRPPASLDESGFARRIAAAWRKFEDQNIVVATSTADRFEISPVLRLILSPDDVELITLEYESLISSEPPAGGLEGNDDDGEDGEEE